MFAGGDKWKIKGEPLAPLSERPAAPGINHDRIVLHERETEREREREREREKERGFPDPECQASPCRKLE